VKIEIEEYLLLQECTAKEDHVSYAITGMHITMLNKKTVRFECTDGKKMYILPQDYEKEDKEVIRELDNKVIELPKIKKTVSEISFEKEGFCFCDKKEGILRKPYNFINIKTNFPKIDLYIKVYKEHEETKKPVSRLAISTETLPQNIVFGMELTGENDMIKCTRIWNEKNLHTYTGTFFFMPLNSKKVWYDNENK
jgi:hypothetical protein